MIHFPVQQGSAEWLRARMGKPTASEFHRLIRPKKWEPTKSETRRAYLIHLLTELILDEPMAGVTVAAMEHGHYWEPKARAAYEMFTGYDVTESGLVMNDNQTWAASPDSFVEQDGLLEVKSPFNSSIHVEYMMRPDSLREEYFVQVQGQLFVCERKWTDLISYHPALPMVKVRVLPNEEFQAKLESALLGFCSDFSDLVARAIDRGYLDKIPALKEWVPVLKKTVDIGPYGITDEDADAILAGMKLDVKL